MSAPLPQITCVKRVLVHDVDAMNATPPATAADQINRQIDGELAKARKSHVGYFRGGANVPALPAREKLPPPVLIVRRHPMSKTHPLVGNVRPFIGNTGDKLPFADLDAAAAHALLNKWHIRLELDKPFEFPWPTMRQTEVTPEQIAAWEAEQAAKAEPAAA